MKHEPLIDESVIPLQYVVGIPVGILLLLIVVYAVWFLVKNQQKQDPLSNKNSHSSSNGYERPPPPPPFTPPNPSYNGKSTPSYKSLHYKAYQHLDPQAAVPLTNGHGFLVPFERDIYEATPQPYELNFSAHDFSDSYSDLSAPRMQHYPSMYSCNR